MSSNVRGAYLSSSVVTASPSTLLVMLCDRLVLDIQRAVQARRADTPAHEHLLHAQDIVMELQASLRPEGWSGAAALASLYSFLHSSLVRANVGRDLSVMEDCLHLATQIQETWRDAALVLAKSPTSAIA